MDSTSAGPFIISFTLSEELMSHYKNFLNWNICVCVCYFLLRLFVWIVYLCLKHVPHCHRIIRDCKPSRYCLAANIRDISCYKDPRNSWELSKIINSGKLPWFLTFVETIFFRLSTASSSPTLSINSHLSVSSVFLHSS